MRLRSFVIFPYQTRPVSNWPAGIALVLIVTSIKPFGTGLWQAYTVGEIRETGQDGGGGVLGMVEVDIIYSGYLPAYISVCLYFNNIIALKVCERVGIFPSGI